MNQAPASLANWWSRIVGTFWPSPTAERSENPFNLHPGDVLETVLLSAFHDGCLRIWRSKGVPEVRRLDVEGAAIVQEVLGRGVLARTSPEPNRYREVGLLHAENQLLCLPDRMMVKNGASEIQTWSRSCRTTLTTPPGPMDIQAWKEWGNWLNAVVLDAASRGEYVVIDKGGWEPGAGWWSSGAEPYVLLGVFHKKRVEVDPMRGVMQQKQLELDLGRSATGEARETQNWESIAEAKPAPAVELWPVAKGGGGATIGAPAGADGGQTIRAPANADTVGVAGILGAMAVSGWARTPLDVVLTFCTNPSGAWRP